MGCLQCGDDTHRYICHECYADVSDAAIAGRNRQIKEFLKDIYELKIWKIRTYALENKRKKWEKRLKE